MTFWHYLIISFFLNGLFSVGIKVTDELGIGSSTPLILFVMYMTAFTAALVHFFLKKDKINKRSLWVGVLAGLSSIGTMGFYMLAMSKLDGYVVFSIGSGGTILATALIGRFLLGERIGPFGLAGVVSGVAAILLLAGK